MQKDKGIPLNNDQDDANEGMGRYHSIWTTTIQSRNLIERTNNESTENVGKEIDFNNTEKSLTKTNISSGPGRYSDRSIF